VEAIRTAKIFVLGDRGDGQPPYISMDRSSRHEDATIAECQQWIACHYDAAHPVAEGAAGAARRNVARPARWGMK
jgi:transcriptional regulator GlxA family with amidase domain